MENLNLGEFLLISNFMIHNFLQFPQQNLPFLLEVCVPELVLNETRRDETRLELISRIGGIRTRLMFSGLVTRENLGKIWEINGTRRDYSLPFGKVSSSTGFWDFSTNFGTNSVPLPKLFIKIIIFIREVFGNSRPKTRPGGNQSRMTGQSRNREKVVPECSGR